VKLPQTSSHYILKINLLIKIHVQIAMQLQQKSTWYFC